MSHNRRRHDGLTKPRTCRVPVRIPGTVLPIPCGDRVFKAHQCHDHYNDWRNGRESRRGTEAVNPKRRALTGTPLPKDLTRPTVATRMVWAEKKKEPESIDDRRRRQGVSQTTQDYLIDRAARKRAHKMGVDYDRLSGRKQKDYRGVRT